MAELKVLDHHQISPLAGSVPSTSLPLTFLDYGWIPCRPIKRLFFYEFPNLNVEQFLQTIVPSLKHSLSLTLEIFFPFAGHLICPLQPNKPHLLYSDYDSVTFTIAESTANFNEIIADEPQDVMNLHHLVPKLPPTQCNENGTLSVPLTAIQATLFSGRGFSVAVTFRHVVADGISFHHFMKTWASICFSKVEDLALVSLKKLTLPSFDREVIPKKLEQYCLNQWWKQTMGGKVDITLNLMDYINVADNVRATFSLSRSQIDNLKRRLSFEYASQSQKSVNFSSFVVTCALFWVCLVKSEQEDQVDIESTEREVVYHLRFLVDCRKRNFKFSVPTYFGNCVVSGHRSLKRKELTGKNAILEAAKAIGNAVLEFNSADSLEGVEKSMSDYIAQLMSGHLIVMAGHSRLGVYETDFGWGRPKKSETAHIDGGGSISLSDSRNEAGGIEVGVAFGRARMNTFIDILSQSLKTLSGTC